MQLVLSLFPGIDLLGRGFEAEGFCVVRGPDIIYGGDIREYHCMPGRFDGVIGGPPCQDFSGLNRHPGEYGLAMLAEWCRVVAEAAPEWFLMENIARVPDIQVPGYTIQRFDLNANECSLAQSRLRHFQFGSRSGFVLIPERRKWRGQLEEICLASEGNRQDRRAWPDFCELQGLDRSFELDGWSTGAKYKAVGNGVPIPMGRVVARAIKSAHVRMVDVRLCLCGCGRICQGGQVMATAGCRKRMQRRRDRSAAQSAGCVTVTQLSGE
jgi:DNA (cytosine-5)-methyltransferase 1